MNHVVINLKERSPFLSTEMAIQIVILNIICTYTWYWKPETGFLILSLTVDSLFSSIEFLRLHLTELTAGETITKLRSLYQVSVIDRYLYYLGLTIIYWIIITLLWGYGETIVYYFLIFNLCPIVINKFRNDWLRGLYDKLNVERSRIIRNFIAYQLSIMINLMSETCVNLRPNVEWSELLPLLKNTERSVRLFYSFITSFIIMRVVICR